MKCSCGFCDRELKNGCMSPDFCKPCKSAPRDENIKICPLCKAEFLSEYDECPNCKTTNKK